jgi:hypothetical protein
MDPIYLKNPDTGLVHLYTNQADYDWAKQWLGWVPASSAEISAYTAGKYISIEPSGQTITRSQEYVEQFPQKATGIPVTDLSRQIQAQSISQFTPSVSTQQAGVDQQALSQFRTTDNQYDLVKMAQAAVNDSGVRDIMHQNFDAESVRYAEYAARPEFDLSGEGSDNWEKLTDKQKSHLRPVRDVDVVEYSHMSDFEKLGVKNIIPKKVSKAEYAKLGAGIKERGLASPEARGWQEKVLAGSAIAAEVLIPGVYLARNWSKMSGAEKGLFIAIDAMCLLPMTGAAVRGARAAYPQTSKLARVAGAGKGIGREAIAFVRSPVDLIVSPIKTIKGAGTGIKSYARNIESVLENVVHPSKIPEAVITTSHGTVRLPLSKTTTTKKAMEFQAKLMELAAKGEKPVVIMGNTRIELSRSPLMKEVGEGLAHGTPMGEAWESGGKVKYIAGKPAREQGLFLSHEPLPRFTLVSAYGKEGEKPVFWILSEKTAKKAIEAEKTYKSTVEMERRLKVGETLFEPKQRLFTRIGSMQDRVEIWLEKPLTHTQIAKLKVQSLIESVKTLAEPSIKVGRLNKGLTDDEVRALAKVIEDSGDAELAARLRRTSQVIERGRTAPPSLARLVGTRQYRQSIETTYRRIAEREFPREVVRVPVREKVREPSREPVRESPREPIREEPRIADRISPREPGRTPPREPDRIPPREPPREPVREPPIMPPPREPPPRRPPIEPPVRVPPARPPPKGFGLEIEHVEGIPKKPGIVVYDMGINRVKSKPPYRLGSEDIEFEHLKTPTKGKGSEQATLHVYDGDAPQKLVLRHGWKRTTILKGEELQNTIIKPRGRGIVMGMDGRVRKSRKKGILARR